MPVRRFAIWTARRPGPTRFACLFTGLRADRSVAAPAGAAMPVASTSARATMAMRAAATARRVMLEYLQTAQAHRGVSAGTHPAGRLIRSARTMPTPAARRYDPEGLFVRCSRGALQRPAALAA